MQITGGRVSFRRVVQPAQYESKEGLVELTFVVPEGEGDKAQAFLDQTAQMAQAKALELVGLKPAPVTAKPDLKVVETPANTGQKEAAAAKINAKDAAAKAKAQEKADAAKKPADELEEPKRNISASPEDRKPADPDGLDGIDTDVLELTDPVKEITDAELRDAVSRWVNKHKDAAAVKELRTKYAGPPPKGLNDIPQPKRQAFIAELEGLAAKAA